MEVQGNNSNCIRIEIIRVKELIVVGGFENEVDCGSESSEQVTVGLEQVNVGLEQVNAGREHMNAGLEQANAGLEHANAGLEQVNAELEHSHSISNATFKDGHRNNNTIKVSTNDFNKNKHDSCDLETDKSKQRSLTSDNFECCGSDSKADYECRFCDYKTKCKHLLKCHWKVNHQGATGMKRCGAIEWFHCELCDYKAKFKHYVKAHFAYKHESSDPLICEFCAHKVRNKYLLDRHIQLNHTENFVYCYCEFCGEKLRDKSYLTKHINARHNENADWHRCQLCEYKTKWTSALKKHMKTRHKEIVTSNSVSPVRVEQTEADWMSTW